ncbi:type 1 fimbrial protein [Proteus mirabilis]|uniref:fimbrial protein n=1 Tax=Proteus mirabilis TaxID=584 RepID=UPI00234947B1|nr:type 1 fimbrial protein [Proteus mirabilis]MDC5894762.1 type 1 fimbrial protein [Proteus mirabilis]MDC5915897.1 type 1 fimbrial protein [Proteus mirabilis]MDC5926414.1 type 1 fimbrial protein [Proteus mirabilis]MDC6011402.1 type 1 fimbrial protein [Proteus mirabilis]MDC6021974.1 type 1 fimbrial protein [Proteus mirabilis]
MKKSLFSLLILSTLSLSTQAIARHVPLDSKDITIQGKVVKKDVLTCQVQPVGVIQLQNAKIYTFENTPATIFNIDFTGCTHPDKNRTAKVVIARQNTTHLVNTGSTENDTNVRIALFASTGELVPLNGNDTDRTFSSDVAGDSGSLAFSLHYDGPASNDAITPGAFKATLSFDAYITDNIVEDNVRRIVIPEEALRLGAGTENLISNDE